MTLEFDKQLYPKPAVIKAAFKFTDIAYLHLSQNENHYIVDLLPKDEQRCADIGEELKNELLLQSMRQLIISETGDLRKLILARALASTMVEGEEEALEAPGEGFNADRILRDWFEVNGGKQDGI